MKLSTRTLVISAMLGALSIVLAVTGLGMIPVPTAAGKATIMHVPVILGAILEGPIVGSLVGLIMGVYSFLNPAGAIPADPFVRILPRILIGISTYYTYYSLKDISQSFAIGTAALVGTVTNTVGFLGMAVVMGYFPLGVAAPIALTHGIPEVIVAVVITVLLVKAIKKVRQ